MSSGLNSKFINPWTINDNDVSTNTNTFVDLSAIFPSYEIITSSATNTNTAVQFTLTRNQNLSTNYVVFPNIYYDDTQPDYGGINTYQASQYTLPLLVYNKTATSFCVAISSSTTVLYNYTVCCLVIYANTNNYITTAYSTTTYNSFGNPTSVNYSENNITSVLENSYNTTDVLKIIDMSSNFFQNIPQNLVVKETFNLTAVSNNKYGYTSSIAGKNFNIAVQPVYNTYNSFECVSPAYSYVNAPYFYGLISVYLPGQIITQSFNTSNNQSTNTQIKINSSIITPNPAPNPNITMAINNLVIFPQFTTNGQTVPNTTQSNYLTNYQTNINSPLNLSQLFCRCQYYSVGINDNNNHDKTFTINITNNTGSTNYYVVASYYYNVPNGTSGTYDIYEASTAIGQIIISEKTSTQFTVSIYKSTGDIWNGGITCMVIFP